MANYIFSSNSFIIVVAVLFLSAVLSNGDQNLSCGPYCKACFSADPKTVGGNRDIHAGVLLRCAVAAAAEARNKAFAMSAKDSKVMPKCAQAFADSHVALQRAYSLWQSWETLRSKKAVQISMASREICFGAFQSAGVAVPYDIVPPIGKLQELSVAAAAHLYEDPSEDRKR